MYIENYLNKNELIKIYMYRKLINKNKFIENIYFPKMEVPNSCSLRPLQFGVNFTALFVFVHIKWDKFNIYDPVCHWIQIKLLREVFCHAPSRMINDKFCLACSPPECWYFSLISQMMRNWWACLLTNKCYIKWYVIAKIK